MQSWFTFELDGGTCRVEHEATHETLADYLVHLDPCFARFQNGDSWLGGSPVIIGDIEGEIPRFRVVDAHLILLPMLAGRQVWTAEGIRAADPYHPANMAIANGHYECGASRNANLSTLFFEGYYRTDLRRLGQMNDQFDGLVSRTANIPAIRRAASHVFASVEKMRHDASQKAQKSGQASQVWSGRKDIYQDRFSRSLHLLKERPDLSYVDRSKRRFYSPTNLVEFLNLRKQYPDAQVIAGGTNLVQKAGQVEWPSLISVENVAELKSVIATQDYWELGSAVSLTRIGELIGRECEPFAKILRRFGSRSIRNRATLGGYLATAWSSGQLSPLLIALKSRVILLSEDGERDAPISQFFEPKERTILRPGEIIRSVLIPRATDQILADRGMTARICDTYTVAPRRSLAEPYVTGAFAIELREGLIAKAWISYSGISDRPLRAREAEESLAGKIWNEDTMFGALTLLNKNVTVLKGENDRADRDYRKQLVITLFQKFFYQHPTPTRVPPASPAATTNLSLPTPPFFDTISG